MSAASLDIAGWIGAVEGLGPGARTVMWVRGCSRACPGCIAPDLQHGGSSKVNVTRLATQLALSLANTRRLTISGGEPFDQPAALAALIDHLKSEVGHFEVLVYTGYRIEELLSEAHVALLDRVDVLIDGPYDENEGDSLIWRGSDNQRLLPLSERARAQYAECDRLTWSGGRQLSIMSLDPETILLVGIPSRSDLADISACLAADGYRSDRGDR